MIKELQLDPGLTILIPAYNEENNIAAAIDSVLYAVNGLVRDYEVLVIDDGSRDKTAAVAGEKAKHNPRIKIFENGKNKGYGVTFQEGVRLATKNYFTLFPGDNDLSPESLRKVIQEIGQAEMIISYPQGGHRRSLFRRAASRAYVELLNGLFGLKMKYYNGVFLYQTERLKSIPIKSEGLGVLAECLIRLLKSGCPYKLVPFIHTGRTSDQSKALTFKSFRTVLKTVIFLYGEIPRRQSQLQVKKTITG